MFETLRRLFTLIYSNFSCSCLNFRDKTERLQVNIIFFLVSVSYMCVLSPLATSLACIFPLWKIVYLVLTRVSLKVTWYKHDWSLVSFSLGSEHAQRDAEEAEKVKIDSKRQANSDSSKDTKPSSPQSPKRALTAAERRALEAEKRAALRQQRMRELEEDAMKAQVVIAQVKAMSATSLEALAINSPDGERKSSASDNELHDGSSPGGPGRRSSGSSTKST